MVQVPQKNKKIALPYNPAIPFLGIYSKKMKTECQRDIRTPMFIAALCTIAKSGKQPTCPSMDEEIKKFHCIYRIQVLLSHIQ